MDARKALITDIFNNSTLIEIPFFQRSYVWKEDLWSRLLEDMEFVVKTKKPHFLGSIILKQGSTPLPGALYSACKTIVDGQQRLTTFLIFNLESWGKRLRYVTGKMILELLRKLCL